MATHQDRVPTDQEKRDVINRQASHKANGFAIRMVLIVIVVAVVLMLMN